MGLSVEAEVTVVLRLPVVMYLCNDVQPTVGVSLQVVVE